MSVASCGVTSEHRHSGLLVDGFGIPDPVDDVLRACSAGRPATYIRAAIAGQRRSDQSVRVRDAAMVWQEPQPYLVIAADRAARRRRSPSPPSGPVPERASTRRWPQSQQRHASEHRARCRARCGAARRRTAHKPAIDVDQARGNPHDQTADLLIFERRQAPGRRGRGVCRIPEPRRKCQQRAENCRYGSPS